MTNNVERPLSPHLQVYKIQYTSATSILHRLTGIVLGAGTLLLAAWLIAMSAGPAAFAAVQGFIGSLVGQVILFGFTVALYYHLCNGIRHLAWDAGYGFSLPASERSAYLVVAATIGLTALTWVLGYMFA